MAGDQIGYLGGRCFGAAIAARLGRRAAPVARATAMLARRGGMAVFLSRWLLSALGPHVNLAAGVARQPWPVFLAASVAGEVVWVGLYLGLGYKFAGNLQAASSAAFDLLLMLGAGAVATGLGLWLIAVVRSERKIRAGQLDESAPGRDKDGCAVASGARERDP